MKGKKHWLCTDSDVSLMHEKYKGKSTIQLWAYSYHSTSKNKVSSKRNG